MTDQPDNLSIEVNVPLDLVRKAAVTAFEKLFAAPAYRDERGGDAYEAVKSAIILEMARVIKDANVFGLVRAGIEEQIKGIVAAVVGEELTRAVKAEVKRQVKAGEVERIMAEGR